MPSDRITDARELNPGDVVVVAVELQEKHGRGTFWWKSFRVVMEKPGRSRYAPLLILKMHPDLDKDFRDVDILQAVVTKLEESAWPQGVSAMYMKHVATGLIKVGD